MGAWIVAYDGLLRKIGSRCNLSVCHALVFMLVVERLSIVGKRDNIEFVIWDKRSPCHSLVHDDVCCFHITRRCLLVDRVHKPRIVEYIRVVQTMSDFILDIETLHAASIMLGLRVLVDVSQLHLTEEIVLLLSG